MLKISFGNRRTICYADLENLQQKRRKHILRFIDGVRTLRHQDIIEAEIYESWFLTHIIISEINRKVSTGFYLALLCVEVEIL